MKRFFVIAVVACLAVSLMAKELPKQGLGLQIGWAQPILRVNSNTSMDTLHTTKLNGFKVGVVYDASIIAGFGTSIGIAVHGLSPYPRQHDVPRSRTVCRLAV